MLLTLFIGAFSLHAEEASKSLKPPKKINLNICKEQNCLDFLPKSEEGAFQNYDCVSCEEEKKFVPYEDFKLTREIGEIAQVAILSEMLAKTQSADDKKNHIRAGAYIGYFSKKACQYGPELLNLDFEIGPTGQFLCAVAGATAAGLLKEAYDSRHPDKHTVDSKDALATSLGAVVTIPLLYIEF